MSNKKNAVSPPTQQHPLIQQQEHEVPNLIRGSGGGSTGIPPTTIQEDEVAATEEQVLHHHETPMVIATLVTMDENPNPTTTTTINASAIQGTQFDTIDNPDVVMEHRMMNTEEESYEEQQQDRLDQKNRCLLHGCICMYIALDFNCHTMGYSRTNTCCCVRHNFCCALYHQHYGLGISIMNRYTPYYYYPTNDEESSTPSFLNVACICCEWGIVKPTTLCTNTEQVLCFQTVGSLPFHRDYVPHPILAYYGLSCCPTCDCCVPPPPCPNLSKQRQHQPLNLTIFRNHHHPHDDMAYHSLPHEHSMYRD